ncbi:MAG: tRNA (guanosine(37)-N1)-methyltransferase TrmD [Betaproteobacteria bacterium]|nr:tRNA (guanosine(37)-N1)-methyltransferase TrmD [Betaproteobacteria bacterium]
MYIDVITLFPEMFDAVAKHGITRRALEQHLWSLGVWNPRDFVEDNYRTIDDRPYGGGPGMVMLAEPLNAAIDAALKRQQDAGVAGKVVYLTPQAKPLTDAGVRRLKEESAGLVLLAGRYEGVDERLIEARVDEEVSIGDYVLSGGELPAMVLIDALVRLLPGALNDGESASQDSYSDGLLDWPHYTRPDDWKGRKVPPVLQSGNHAAIEKWRRKQALGRTWLRRPEMIAALTLNKQDLKLLEEFRQEQAQQRQQEQQQQ